MQSSIEAHELRLTERTSKREVEQTLKAYVVKTDQKHSWSEAKNRRDDRFQKSETSTSDENKHQKGKEKKKVQCYCCKQFDHFARDCWSNKGRKSEEANIARGDSDDETVLLMASESDGRCLED